MGIEKLNPILLETERLYLRELSPETYQHLFTSCSDNEISDYFGFRTDEELNAEKDKFSQGITTYSISFCKFHLIDKASGSVIGDCDYHTWILKHRRAELGYKLFDDVHKRKGLMTEALGAVLTYGFEEMNLYRIEALIAPYNTPSQRLLKHYGFKEEGTMRGHYAEDGVNEDSIMLSLLLPEYEELKSSWEKQKKPFKI